MFWWMFKRKNAHNVEDGISIFLNKAAPSKACSPDALKYTAVLMYLHIHL